VRGRRLPDDEVDRLLREALADDLPKELEEELRRGVRQAWRRAASEPRRARWQDWLGIPNVWRPLLPQPALVAAALAMLGAGAVMQAAPPPPAVVESLQGRQASARVAQALGRATAMECAVEVADERGRRLSYRIDWRAPGETRVRFDGAAGPGERVLRLLGAGLSVLTRAAAAPADGPLDATLEPARGYLSPAAIGERLAAPWRPGPGGGRAMPATETFFVGPRSGPSGLTVAIDTATHLPLRLDATDRDGRTQAAVCRWP
jgi:hypothetical protein